ncbi:unnamed protein product [Rotaria sordida]|uniref:C2H2-type domain-containing protein n=1 Tax=Rotaria sordida TaxID=392033 RepID=A0A815Q935_9BILA|nr:unnamed protein product [Rotaria sordida]
MINYQLNSKDELLIPLVAAYFFLIGLAASDAAELKRDLQNGRNYLKTDYKVHVSCSSTVPDHCSIFSLSDPINKCWQNICDHNHDQQCDRCELLKITFVKIRTFIEQYQQDVGLRDRLIHRIQQQVQYENDLNDSCNDDSSGSEEEYDDNSNLNNAPENDHYSFDCLVDGCTARYQYHANLLRHYTTGKHKLQLEKHTLIDKSKILFHQSLTTNHLHSTPLLSITVIPPINNSTIPSLPQNWASQKIRPNVRFNDKQKEFLQEKFNEGTNDTLVVKWDPVRVALDMEMLMSNGCYVFHHDECLTQGQIKSYFSRLANEQRSVQQIFSQETPTNITSYSSSSISGINTNNTKLNDTTITDESNDNEDIDDRDLEVYSWHQMLDEARVVFNRLSIPSTT